MKKLSLLAVSALLLSASVSLVAQSAPDPTTLPDNIVGAGIRADFTFQQRPKITASFLQASKTPLDYLYTFNTVDIMPVFVKSNGRTVITFQTVTQVGVAPVVYRYKAANFFLIGQAGAGFRPSFAAGNLGSVASAFAAATGAGVGIAIPGKFAKDHGLISIASVRYQFAGGTGLQANQVAYFVGKGF